MITQAALRTVDQLACANLGGQGIAQDAIPRTGTYANPYANQLKTGELSVDVRRHPQAFKIDSELQGSATPADTRAHV